MVAFLHHIPPGVYGQAAPATRTPLDTRRFRPMTQVWGHRGASGAAPENTLAAFELAVRLGAHGVELDAQRSADGVVVVVHDETVDRTTAGTGRVVDLTADQLAALGIPTLAQVLDLLAPTGLRVNVELKNGVEPYPGLVEDVEAVTAASRLAADAPERILYSSFNHRSLARLTELGSRVPRGVLHVEAMVRPWEYAASFGAQALHPMAVTVLAEEVALAHEAGMAVHAWTVDDPDAVRLLAAAGVDAVITNVPDVALAALA